MWKKRKYIIIAAVVSVLLVIGIAGVALAQTSDNGTSRGATLIERVATILGIDQQKVEDAFKQARTEIAEEALQERLDAMVASGRLTQEQANEYRDWWQSRPDDIPGPVGPGIGFHRARGFGGMGWCLPYDTDTIPTE